MKDYIKYTGKALSKFNAKLELDAYIPSAELIQAVETARLLNRPLLIRGEPGCGKTRLAEALAVELHGPKYPEFYFPWPIKSTTKAAEGLYTFDHLERLRDVNAQTEDPTRERYVKLGPIGKAFEKLNEAPNAPPPILLIDEIDKADIDFPNDLLWELDKREFFIPEIKTPDGSQRKIGGNKQTAPIIIITSNDEKDLPNAFLRRCIFHYISFPGNDRLFEIVKRKLEGLSFKSPLKKKEIENLIHRFTETRKKLSQAPSAVKPPSTSELLDWAQLTAFYLTQPNWKLDKESLNLLEGEEVRLSPEDLLLKTLEDYISVGGSNNN